ncbi:MAG TPA: VWA domain-containing protein [Candidatus Hydrogenedentes bacterium]|nr:VWA domain-containing protein [Candidatus Hydrogenedentota bacterium]
MKFGFRFPLSQLPLWLTVALGAVLLSVGALYWLEIRRKRRIALFVQHTLLPRLVGSYDERVRRPLFWFTVLGFAFLLLALAQPHWGRAWKEVRKHSRDVLVCLDISESMRATDLLPGRLERAKQKIVTLVDHSPGDRFGLIAFTGAAGLQCPMTLDHGYFKAVLSAVDTDSISREGTDIAAALAGAVEVFKDEDTKRDEFARDTRAILLISDGEEVSGDAIEMAREASQYCRVYVIGVGDPDGAEIEIPGWMAREGVRGAAARGMTHLSKLDEETLIRVADAGNGPYVAATPDDWDIEQIRGAMERLESRMVESDVRLQLVNRYQWPLTAAIALFAAEGFWLAAMPWLRAWKARRATQPRRETQHG